MEAATRRLASLVEDSAITANTTWPGCNSDSPSSRSTSSQCGGKIELTRTRLKLARWASRSAISKLVNFSLCRPTPLVRKALVGTNIRDSINPSPRARQRGFCCRTAFARSPDHERGPGAASLAVPDRWADRHRRFRVAAALRRRLHHLGDDLGGRERGLADLDARLTSVLAAHDQHVACRVDAQPGPSIQRVARDHRRAPLAPLPLEGPEQVDRVDLRRGDPRSDRLRELRPARPPPRL